MKQEKYNHAVGIDGLPIDPSRQHPSTNIEQREGFTRGEWVRRDLEILGPYETNKHICEITGNFMNKSEALANAALIAAAPTMYAFIKEMAERYSNSEWIAGRAKEILLKANPKQ